MTKKIIAGLVANFPETERELLIEQSIIATMLVPIFVNDEFWGYIGLDECKSIRTWSKEIKEIMQTFADVIGSTIYTQEITSEIKNHSDELKKKQMI